MTQHTCFPVLEIKNNFGKIVNFIVEETHRRHNLLTELDMAKLTSCFFQCFTTRPLLITALKYLEVFNFPNESFNTYQTQSIDIWWSRSFWIKHSDYFFTWVYNFVNDIVKTVEVKRAIDYLKNNTSLGIDGIAAELIKCFKSILSVDITIVLNFVIGQRDFPNCGRRDHGLLCLKLGVN